MKHVHTHPKVLVHIRQALYREVERNIEARIDNAVVMRHARVRSEIRREVRGLRGVLLRRFL